MHKIPTVPLFMFAALLAAPFASEASLLVYDDFSYEVPEGSSTVSVIGLDGGTGWGGAWTSSVSGTGNIAGTIRADRSYEGSMPAGYTLPIGPNSLNVTADTALSATRVNRALSADLVNFDAEGDRYFSFAFARVDGTNNGGSEGCSLNFLSSSVTKLSVGVDSSEYLTMNASGTITTSATASVSFSGNWATTGKYLIVGKIETGSDGVNNVYLSLFDSSGDVSSEPLTWDLVVSGVDITGSADTISLVIGKYAQNIVLDNLAIGETFIDVTTAIPEPALGALLAGSLAMALVVRRRR